MKPKLADDVVKVVWRKFGLDGHDVEMAWRKFALDSLDVGLEIVQLSAFRKERWKILRRGKGTPDFSHS